MFWNSASIAACVEQRRIVIRIDESQIHDSVANLPSVHCRVRRDDVDLPVGVTVRIVTVQRLPQVHLPITLDTERVRLFPDVVAGDGVPQRSRFTGQLAGVGGGHLM